MATRRSRQAKGPYTVAKESRDRRIAKSLGITLPQLVALREQHKRAVDTVPTSVRDKERKRRVATVMGMSLDQLQRFRSAEGGNTDLRPLGPLKSPGGEAVEPPTTWTEFLHRFRALDQGGSLKSTSREDKVREAAPLMGLKPGAAIGFDREAKAAATRASRRPGEKRGPRQMGPSRPGRPIGSLARRTQTEPVAQCAACGQPITISGSCGCS